MQAPQEISKEEFLSWKHNVITQAVFEAIRQEREGAKEHLANAKCATPEDTQKVIGYAIGLNEILNISYSDEVSENV